MTRGAYGPDEVYTRMALDSLADWTRLSAASGLPLFHRTGVLFFFPKVEPYVSQSLEVHRRLKLPTERLDRTAMQRRFPMIDFSGVEVGLYEPGFGALMARRAVRSSSRPSYAVAENISRRLSQHLPQQTAHASIMCRPPTADVSRPTGSSSPAAPGCLSCSPTSWATHLPHAAGSLLLRAPGRRSALRAGAAARLGRFQ
jgi:hypothetical protein